MDWLNYHHLLYFWTVAREGSIVRASQKLHLAQPTVSAQVRALEKTLGARLFERQGRGLQLTETGRLVLRYADEIFNLGRELTDTLRGRPTGRPLRLAVGVADAVPKLVAYRLLEPATRLSEPVQIVCYEGKPELLLASLALHELDIVLSDTPVGTGSNVRAFSHQLGDCGVRVVGSPALVGCLVGAFPASLNGAPFLLPTENTALRRSLNQWFDAERVRPRVVAEFEDSALLKVFGQEGLGLFVVADVIASRVCTEFGVVDLGAVPRLRERFYAISIERRLKHPAVLAICEAARGHLFA